MSEITCFLSEKDYGELDFYDLYDALYPMVNGEPLPYEVADNLDGGTIYQIPKAEFEKVIMAYFQIDSETLQSKTVYDAEIETYEYRPRGRYEAEFPEYPYSEVTAYTENEDGTRLRLTRSFRRRGFLKYTRMRWWFVRLRAARYNMSPIGSYIRKRMLKRRGIRLV